MKTVKRWWVVGDCVEACTNLCGDTPESHDLPRSMCAYARSADEAIDRRLELDNREHQRKEYR